MLTDRINITWLNSTNASEIINMYVVPEDDWHDDWYNFNETLLNFTWTTRSFIGDTIVFDLKFHSPHTISPLDVLDILVFNVNDTTFF